jgi:hypothetical protein
MQDNIHPGVTGGLLLADLLTSYVADADERYRRYKEESGGAAAKEVEENELSDKGGTWAAQGAVTTAGHSQSREEGHHDSGQPGNADHVPRWLVPESVMVPHTRCYGSLVRPSGSDRFQEVKRP